MARLSTPEEIAALVLAAAVIAALLRFVWDRAFVLRLEPSVSGEVWAAGDYNLIRIFVSLKNIGTAGATHTGSIPVVGGGGMVEDASIVAINACRVVENNNQPEVHWIELPGVQILAKHERIEAGETIYEEHLVAVPSDQYHAYELGCTVVCEHPILAKLRFRGKPMFGEPRREWDTSAVVFSPHISDNSCAEEPEPTDRQVSSTPGDL